MLRRQPRDDDGISIVELLVAMGITTMLLSLVAAMFIQITKLTGDGQSTQRATGTAWTVMTEVAGVVRQATQISTTSSTTEGAVVGGVDSVCAAASGSTTNCLIVDTYSNVTISPGQSGLAPVRVVFSVDGVGNLLEKRYAATLSNGYYGFGTTPAVSSRTVGGPIDITGTSTSAITAPCSSDGNQVGPGSGTNALFVYCNAAGNEVIPGSAGLTAAQAATVTAVRINVVVANPLSRGADPVLLSNRVIMPNVAIVNGGS
jgi:hypothetical protein